MSATINSGPFVSAGQLLVPFTSGTNTPVPVGTSEFNTDAGPSLSYQGDGILDCRYYVQKDYGAGRQGIVYAHLNSPYILSCDAVPAASAATPVNIAAAAALVSGTPMVLAAASAGISTAVPFYPFQSNTLVLANIALDFGFMAAATNAANDTFSINGTVTATASSLAAASNFYPGQWLVLPNAIAAGASALICYVVSVSGTTITLSAAPTQTTTTQMVGTANIPNSSWLGNPTPTGAFPYLAGGIGGFLDPKQSIARGVGIVATAGGTATLQIQGWDIYNQPQTENIVANGATAVYGKKTWKYIQAVVPQATDAGHTYSVGTSDLFGFVVRTDRWEYTNEFWNGSFITAAGPATTGTWTKADLTNPATSTTGDVRGTFQPSARGPSATPTGQVANGTARLALFTSIPLYNLISATPFNPAPLYGVVPQ